LTESVKKDRTLFLTGAVLFSLSFKGQDAVAHLLQRPVLLQVVLLGVLGWASWTRRFRPALSAAAGLAFLQAAYPWLLRMRQGSADLDTLLPLLLWTVVLAANARKERREVYFDA